MILGIDASNIRAGGGVTHLAEVLRAAEPAEHGFEKVVVWAGASTLGQVEARPWLKKVHVPLLDRSIVHRLYWQRFILDRAARRAGCDILFVPGGSYRGSFRPFVTMSRNLLPFESTEAGRFGVSWPRVRYYLLQKVQSSTFCRSQGVIFLSAYARRVVSEGLQRAIATDPVIPHGVNEAFRCPPRRQRAIADYSTEAPFRILYVSIVNLYKHQWHVAEAVAKLQREGLPVQLGLIGPAYPPALKRLQQTLRQLDPDGVFLQYRGVAPYTELPGEYHKADLFVFASSCETFGQVVTEGMAAGLPIACSNRGPMPEVLGEAGLYFDPERPDEIADCLRRLIADPSLRDKTAHAAHDRAKSYSWRRCADETFAFLAGVAHNGKDV